MPGKLLNEAKSLWNKVVKMHITLDYIKDHSEIEVATSEDNLLNVLIHILIYPRDKMIFLLNILERAIYVNQKLLYKNECQQIDHMEISNQKYIDKDTDLKRKMYCLQHLCRELAHQHKITKEQYQPEATKIASLVADALVDGVAVELLDGDSTTLHIDFLNDMAKYAEARISDNAKIITQSVPGFQSCGESTIFNALFGVHFYTSKGACARGAIVSLVHVGGVTKAT